MGHLRRSIGGAAATRATVDANEISLETKASGGRSIIVVAGRVTVDSSPHLRRVLHNAINANAADGVVIDVSATLYMDTSAIATLLEAATLGSQRRVSLALVGLNGDARLVAEATELDRILVALGYEVQFT